MCAAVYSTKQTRSHKYTRLDLDHRSVLEILQKATQKHYNCLKEIRDDDLSLQFDKVYELVKSFIQTALILMLLLSCISLFILHGIDLGRDSLQLVSKIVHIVYNYIWLLSILDVTYSSLGALLIGLTSFPSWYRNDTDTSSFVGVEKQRVTRMLDSKLKMKSSSSLPEAEYICLP